MAVHYYVQDRDLKDLMQNWATNPHFARFILSFPDNDVYGKEDLVRKYLTGVKERHTKHFKKWKVKYLQLLLASDEIWPPHLLADWLL